MADNTPASPAPRRIYQQIEQTADRYPPGVYDLLTFQRRNWQTGSDPLSNDFIPLSSVPIRSPKDALMFVVGLIPPSANVTGNLLDRSATVAAVKGFAEEVDVTAEQPKSVPGVAGSGNIPEPYIVSAPGYQINPATGKSFLGVPISPGGVNLGEKVDPVISPTKSPAEMNDLFHDAYKKVFGTEPSPTELLFIVAQSKRETSGAWYNNNPGFIHAGPNSKNSFKHNKDTWQSYESPQQGAEAMVKHVYGNPNTRKAASSGDAMGYMTSLAQTGYMGESIHVYYTVGNFPVLLRESAAGITKSGGSSWQINLPREVPNSCAFKEDVFEYRKRTGWSGKNPPVPQWVKDQGIPVNDRRVNQSTFRFNKVSLYDEGCPLEGATAPDDPNKKPPGWSDSGSKAAQDAQKAQSKYADKDLNQSELGQQLQGAQKDYIRALQISLEQMAKTPPLRMLVNPISFKVAEEKIIADGSFSRAGTIVEHWGEQQTKITANGKLAGFYAIDVGSSSASVNANGSAGNGPGLTRSARNFSESYQNFLSLYLIYRNNGGIWLEDFNRKNPKMNNLAMVGSVYIYYDNTLYIGSFDSFNVSESDTAPFTLEYDYSFTVRAKFDLDRVPNPLEQYGNSELFAMALPAIPGKSIPTTTAVTNPTVEVPSSPEEQAFLDKARADAQELAAQRASDAKASSIVSNVDALFDSPLAKVPAKAQPKGSKPALKK